MKNEINSLINRLESLNRGHKDFEETAKRILTNFYNQNSNRLEKLSYSEGVSQPGAVAGNEELLPCPFCGGEGQYFCWDNNLNYEKGEWYAIHCEDCEMKSPIYETMENAKTFWNKRATASL